MFAKKAHVDTRKSISKVIDPKKDSLYRLKHLRIVLDNLDIYEAKIFFEEHYSPIYYVFYDVFVSIESSLKQRGHKTQKEDFDTIQYTLEKILVLLPELLSKRWQCHSLQRIIKKFLHPGNSLKVRKEGVRLFVILYQILGENSPPEMDVMFSHLVPGIIPNQPKFYAGSQAQSETSLESVVDSSTFYSGSHSELGPVWAGEISPIMPPHGTEVVPDNLTRVFLGSTLDFMVSQVHRIEWKEKVNPRQQACFNFLFEKFKTIYLPHIFHHISFKTSLYQPNLELPTLRFDKEAILMEGSEKGLTSHKDSLIQCQSIVIRWFTNFSHQCFKKSEPVLPTYASEKNDNVSDRHIMVPDGVVEFGGPEQDLVAFRNQQLEHYIVTSTLYSCRENVNLIHEIFRQAFLVTFTQSGAMRRVIAVYKDWIYLNLPEKPTFLEEPLENERSKSADTETLEHKAKIQIEGASVSGIKPSIRAGLQNMLKVFVTNAANVFLLEVSPEKLILLEEQVDMCKRVLNIYRYMVMNVKMEKQTWEQLLLVLLQVSSLVLKELPPIRKEESLGGRLAPALFQTLIVTWIKANLNVIVSTELWNRFLSVLSSLTRWEELIKEWGKTMETLTRVLARQVYNLDLNDLPLNRPTEQKQKKKRGMSNNPSSSSSRKVSPGHQAGLKSVTTGSNERTTTEMKRLRCNSGDSSQRIHFLRTRRASSLQRWSSDSYLHVRKSIGDEHTEILASGEYYIQELRRQKSLLKNKSKSADYIHRADSPCLSESFEYRSRSPSPTPSSGVESSSIKDSPMQIDVMMSSADNSCNNSEILSTGSNEVSSVMAGGNTRGWLPEVAVALWRRMLGALGNINSIQDPAIHCQVVDFLVELSETLIMIRDNMSITVDNQSSPLTPELVPPLHLFTPWLFEAISLPKPYERGKLLAYRLLCSLTVRRHDILLTSDYLSQFYLVLHNALVSEEKAIISTIVKFCGPQIFSIGLPGASLLLMDFILGANTVISSTEAKGMPRTEAMTTLGSLLCYLRIYNEVPILQPASQELAIKSDKEAKDYIINMLIKSGKQEPAGMARCIAISSIGIFVYGELLHETMHPKLRDAINVLLAALRFNSRPVSQVACDMLLLQCDHAKYILKNFPDITKSIVQVISSTIMTLLPSLDAPLTEDEKKLLLSLIFCLGEWCMSIPSSLLSSKKFDNEELLSNVFKVLNSIVTGNDKMNVPPPNLEELVGPEVDPDIHLENFQEGVTLKVPNSSRHCTIDSPEKSQSSVTSSTILESSFLRASSLNLDPKTSFKVVRLAAKTVMGHLINYLGHFPMGAGAAHLTSLVTEQDDRASPASDDLSPQILQAPNTQLFVLNNASVFSVVEVPALDVPGGGATAGLTTASSQVRVIIRDQNGKFSWDCSILYGPPGCSKGSAATVPLKMPLSYSPHFPRFNSNNNSTNYGPKSKSILQRSSEQTPSLEGRESQGDNLDEMLKHIGETSPECIHRGGNPLNMAPESSPECIELETVLAHTILNQRNNEVSYVEKHAKNPSFVAKPVQPPDFCIPNSPFQYCKILLNQLGFVSWEKRPQIDLLQKNEKLTRELRNLDQQKCRETHKIAVIFVANGQEDKNSLLLNTSGSPDFEQFVAGLGWEVDLETHAGFMGGLQRNGSTGTSAPFYATSFVEVIFHVSTRMTMANDDDSLIKKLRHLGNDEVHIVWSEHRRDYRRGIIATEFCDILIVIYPISKHLFRIQISRKAEIPFFGPLYNGAIIDRKLLPGLVRATAINASRAKRSIIPFSQSFFEERAKSLETIVQNLKEPTTFEQFAASVYSPSSPAATNGAITSSLHDENISRPTSSTTLASALLDSHHTSNPPVLRAIAASTQNSARSSPQPPIRQHRERPLSASHSHSSSPLSQH